MKAKIGNLLIVLGIINIVSYASVHAYFGGNAQQGKKVEDLYYLGRLDAHWEVQSKEYIYSFYHGYFALAAAPMMLLGALWSQTSSISSRKVTADSQVAS